MVRFLLFLLSFTSLNAFSQSTEQTAIQLIARTSSPEDGLYLSQSLVTSLHTALKNMEQSQDPKALEVTQKYGIKYALELNSTKEVIIYLSHEDIPQQCFENLEATDCNFSQIFKEYNLNIDGIKSSDAILEVSLTSKDNINISYLAQQLSLNENITMVEIPNKVLEGNDIQARRHKNGWILSYILKTSDCGIGCQKQYIWEFEVTDDGNINFLSEYGDAF